MAKVEREHHKTIVGMMDGKVESAPSTISNSNDCSCGCCSYSDEEGRQNECVYDARICLLPKNMSRRFRTLVFSSSQIRRQERCLIIFRLRNSSTVSSFTLSCQIIICTVDKNKYRPSGAVFIFYLTSACFQQLRFFYKR